MKHIYIPVGVALKLRSKHPLFSDFIKSATIVEWKRDRKERRKTRKRSTSMEKSAASERRSAALSENMQRGVGGKTSGGDEEDG